jgi:MoxR-like ATPase
VAVVTNAVDLESPDDVALADRMKTGRDRIIAELRKAIVGQEDVVNEVLLTLFTGGNSLIVGVPGLAKTLLVHTLARVLELKFARIQFTPDLMPSDITGTDLIQEDPATGRRQMVFSPGPIFANIVLADEINRTPPKTQSALLEAMQERTVTIDRESHHLSPNFTVFATQNPIESEGTYPLPEAQKDRFMLKIPMDWPESEEELSLARRSLNDQAPEAVLERGEAAVCFTESELKCLREALALVVVSDALLEYGVQVVRRTRTDDGILVGAGPRATQSLLRAARAWAGIAGRDFVSPDDIRAVARPVLEHRLLLRPESELEGVRPAEILDRILHEVPVPR